MRSVLAVMDVMELADRRVSGERHLDERIMRERVDALGVETLGELVHHVAPRPERARVEIRALRTCAERPLECVRVRRREARQYDAISFERDRHSDLPRSARTSRTLCARVSRHVSPPRQL